MVSAARSPECSWRKGRGFSRSEHIPRRGIIGMRASEKWRVVGLGLPSPDARKASDPRSEEKRNGAGLSSFSSPPLLGARTRCPTRREKKVCLSEDTGLRHTSHGVQEIFCTNYEGSHSYSDTETEDNIWVESLHIQIGLSVFWNTF